jgi:alkanesulfonate monooxygenase SsuD/methylene tetrahydromethanopterin reductase-like flavin-dependent oxidoreductase (luciferase family)
MDRGAVPLAEQYENRLRLIEAYERAGFYAYHIAEHHSTPLGMAPSPSVFLSAAAQRTRRLRLGALVYPLSFHHPLRVMEEICMLDHLSGGRLDVGFGRGISPIEIEYYGEDPGQAQARFLEAQAVVMQALTTKTLDFDGKYFHYKDVPIEMEPFQRPHPPLWVGIGTPESAAASAKLAINAVSNGPTALVRTITDRYREEWSKQGRRDADLPLIGMSRHVVLAETEEEALNTARHSYKRWFESFIILWKRRGIVPASTAASYPDNFDDAMRAGFSFAGTPGKIRAALSAQIEEAGINYLLCRICFGDMSMSEASRTVELFSREVMPALSGSRAAAE